MQALSISSGQSMLKFDAIVELVKSIAQLLKDNVKSAIVRTRENDRFFASVPAQEEQEQPDTNKIDRAAAEKNIEIINFIPPAVSNQDEIREINKKDRKILYRLPYKSMLMVLKPQNKQIEKIKKGR